jgi:hypothetical protein
MQVCRLIQHHSALLSLPLSISILYTLLRRSLAVKQLTVLAVDNFVIPGDANWKLGAVIPPSDNRKDKGASPLPFFIVDHAFFSPFPLLISITCIH